MLYRCSLIISVLIMAPLASTADPVDLPTLQQTVANNFPACVERFKQQALDENFSETLVETTLAGLQPRLKVIQYDRRQPEFTQTFEKYFTARVTERSVNRGRNLLTEYRPLLDQLTRQYGVPPQYLVAFWGLETRFGSYLGKMPTLDSLATLACDERRSAFFTSELMAALGVIRDHQIDPATMRGSWAGAVGHTQFMPSAYLAYAVDGDGDGRADLWNSIPDALTSAANFLQQLGWQRELRWGREVIVPQNFNYALSGRDLAQPMSNWIRLKLKKADGSPLAALDIDAALVIPAGHSGPAFLVYDNFNVIMRWNRSEFYALTVGILADRINGAGQLVVAPPAEKTLNISQVMAMQNRLNQLGFDSGAPDGILGSKTRIALRKYEASIGEIADGYPDDDIRDLLMEHSRQSQ